MTMKNDCAPMPSYGCLLQMREEQSTSFINIGGIRDFNGPNVSRGEIDVTTLNSTSKEFMPDLKDSGTFTANMLFCPCNPAQRLLMDGLDSNKAHVYRVIFPDVGNGNTGMEFDGNVQSFPISASQGAAVSVALSLRITGDVRWDFPETIGPNLGFSTFVLDESAANDGSVSGLIAVTLHGAAFAGTNGNSLPGVSFSNVPAGLTAVCTRNGDTSVSIRFTGKATQHASGSTANVGVVFGDAAFKGSKAQNIANANGRNVSINFVD